MKDTTKPKPSLFAKGFALTHVGAVRRRNEDHVYVCPTGKFAILADGMGGHRGGQEASIMAIELMRKNFENWLSSKDSARAPIEFFLKNGFIDTSARIHAAGQENPELAHMGATLVCWFHAGDEVFVAHSGDSRAYLFRDGLLFQMTPDHTMENEHILAGRPRAEVEKLPIKHVLSRNVGMMPASEPDVLRFSAKHSDIWLLCSDGLSNKLTATQIQLQLRNEQGNLPKTAKKLIEQAYHAGGEDNITVCLMVFQKLPTLETQK